MINAPDLSNAFNDHFSSMRPKLANENPLSNGNYTSYQKYINGIDKSFQFRPTNDRQVLSLPNSIRLRAAALTKYLVSLFDIATMLFRHILHLSLIDL